MRPLLDSFVGLTLGSRRTRQYSQREEVPLPQVPTCFRPQAAVITAQPRLVDEGRSGSNATVSIAIARTSSSSCGTVAIATYQ